MGLCSYLLSGWIEVENNPQTQKVCDFLVDYFSTNDGNPTKHISASVPNQQYPQYGWYTNISNVSDAKQYSRFKITYSLEIEGDTDIAPKDVIKEFLTSHRKINGLQYHIDNMRQFWIDVHTLGAIKKAIFCKLLDDIIKPTGYYSGLIPHLVNKNNRLLLENCDANAWYNINRLDIIKYCEECGVDFCIGAYSSEPIEWVINEEQTLTSIKTASSHYYYKIPAGVKQIDKNVCFPGRERIVIPKSVISIYCPLEHCHVDYQGNLNDWLGVYLAGPIHNLSFSGKRLDKIKIPNGITKISQYLFAFTRAKTISIPDSVKEIEDHAFETDSWCNPPIINLPVNLIKIGKCAFKNCRFKNFKLPSSVQVIDDYAFCNARLDKHPQNITIPASVTRIGSDALPYARKVTIMNKNCQISEKTFDRDTVIDIPDYDGDFLALGDVLLRYLGNNKDVIIPNGIKKIAAGAFDNKSCTTIKCPDSLTTIPSSCFYYSTLTSITLPKHMESIGSYAFAGTKLTDIVLPETVNKLGLGILKDCEKLKSVSWPTNISKIPAYTFLRCSHLRSFDIPDNVTQIGAKAFAWSGLKSLKIGPNVSVLKAKSIGCDCPDLEEVIIESSTLTGKEWSGFENCPNLKRVTLSDSLQHMPHFSKCKQIQSVNIPTNLKAFDIFFSKCSVIRLTAPDGFDVNNIQCNGAVCIDGVIYDTSKTSVLAYIDNQLQDVIMPDSVIKLPKELFKNCTSLCHITLPKNLDVIPKECFVGCKNLQTVVLPENLIRINENAFAKCTSLGAVDVPATTTTIRAGAFYKCPKVKPTFSPRLQGKELNKLERQFAKSKEKLFEDTPKKSVPKTCTEILPALKEVYGNVLEHMQDGYLVHCVTADFSLGSGIAKQLDEAFQLARHLQQSYGDVPTHDLLGRACLTKEHKIFSLVDKATKDDNADYLLLEKALFDMKEQCLQLGVSSLVMPKIGCGHDRLHWTIVSEMVREVFADTNIDITVYYR
ncbi:MAG: leucine-rich repeat protein [Alphaproteobacteria bacterium]|nr:leucine-rich repeat protein [Alphaproteobacteria bacterium]